ncbi:hypothetical protein CHLNCDRAFT_133340, partial [Chlorella variabilis]
MPAASATAAQQQARPAHSSGSSGAIPAFRPASPHHTASHYTPSPSTSDDSPGKAQLQAVRALRQQAPQQQQQQAAPQQAAPQQAAPQGTPGYSESSSVGRAINAHIASSIADLFMPTPSAPGAGSCGSGSGGGGGHHGAASRPAPAPNSATGSPGCAPSSRGSGDSGSCCSGGQGWQTPEAQRLAASPGGGGMPVPPPAPPLLRTAMTETSALELQSFLSPVFMTRKQRPMACEMDEPGSAIPFPKAHRRTSRLQRFAASMFGCFVPPPDKRSPAPSLRTPGSRRAPSFRATSSPRAHLALNVEPLRQSLAGLAGGDSDLRASLVAAAADGARGPAGAAAAAPAGASQFGELLGMQRRVVEEEEDGLRMNMASPVLLSRPGSAAATPATEAAGSEEAAGCAANVLAKRNLMDVLRSKETGAVRQQPLQAWQRQAGGAPPAKHAAGGRGGKAQAKASHVSLDAPTFTPKRRDLSKPSYRSDALHHMLSPGLAARRRGGAQASAAALWRSLSAPASPHQHAPGAGAGAAGREGGGAGGGGSVPSSPLFGAPRLNRAATIRAAASQRKLQERQAQSSAFLAKSPDTWLRAAAAEGLSLRDAAVLASPGKSARPQYHPSPAPRGHPRGQRQPQAAAAVAAAAAAAAGVRAGTPGGSRFDSFETGVEPYSARLLTAEKQRQGGGGPVAPAAPPPPGQPGAVDFARLAADRDAYLQMLQMLAEGLQVEGTLIHPHKQPPPPPLPADLLARAAAAGRRERRRASADGADTVRPRLSASHEWLDSSRTHASTAVYSLHAASTNASLDSAERVAGLHLVPLTPHHNALFGNDATPTKSSPVAIQRMLSMSAAVAAQLGTEEQEQGRQAAARGSRQAPSVEAASSSVHSISFGSGGCREPRDTQAQDCGSSAAGQQQQRQAQPQPAGGKRDGRRGALEGGNARLGRLAALLEVHQRLGQHCGLQEIRAAGFSDLDLQALKAWLGRQAGASAGTGSAAAAFAVELAAARGLAQHAARAAGHLGSQLAGAARSAAAAAPPPPLEPQQPQLQGLLASVSGSALQEPQQKAFLPDKRRGGGGRGGRNPSVGGVAEGGGTEGGGGVLADADENERFLVSEVDVVGVDGELKDIAMRALSTRANFAYSQKEIMDDMHRVFDTGYFSLCKPVAEETRDGIKLTLEARRLCRLAAAWLLFGCRLAAAA